MSKYNEGENLNLGDLADLFEDSFTVSSQSGTSWSFSFASGYQLTLSGTKLSGSAHSLLTGTISEVLISNADGVVVDVQGLDLDAQRLADKIGDRDGDHDGTDDDDDTTDDEGHDDAEDDDIIGGHGHDKISGGHGRDHLEGGRGDDRLSGDDGDDDLIGGIGDDDLSGGIGDDVLAGGTGNDHIRGDDGDDTASYASSRHGVKVDLGHHTATGEGTDTLSGIEDVVGSDRSDTITGEGHSNHLKGGHGNDNIDGGRGNDELDGDAGSDDLEGGKGDDILAGGGGNDHLVGGSGHDTASYADAETAVKVDLTRGKASGEGSDKLSGIEDVTGSDHDDDVSGSQTHNALMGGAGDDRLDGKLGSDILKGGAGDDIFEFSTVINKHNVDTIVDFVVGQDTIEIDDKIFKALSGTSDLGEDSFFIGSAAHDADDHIIYNASTGALSYDADGTGKAAARQFATLAPELTTLSHHSFDLV